MVPDASLLGRRQLDVHPSMCCESLRRLEGNQQLLGCLNEVHPHAVTERFASGLPAGAHFGSCPAHCCAQMAAAVKLTCKLLQETLLGPMGLRCLRAATYVLTWQKLFLPGADCYLLACCHAQAVRNWQGLAVFQLRLLLVC